MFNWLWDALRKRSVERSVRRHGWTGIYVGDYSTAPTWAYTIGFRASLAAPEIVVFDLPPASADAVFHELYRQLKTGELVIGDGELWRADEGARSVWRKVHPSRFVDDEEPWLGIALVFDNISNRQPGDFEAYQLVLSDADGRLPWDAGYDERLRPRQRALYEPPP
jgi:uncharacterized protein DUF4262